MPDRLGKPGRRLKVFTSTRQRLALLITLVAIVVVMLFGMLAVREVRSSAQLAASERLESVTRQLTYLLASQVRELRRLIGAIAGDAAIVGFARAPGASGREAALATLRELAAVSPTTLDIEIWNGEGRRLLTTRETVPEVPEREARELIATLADSAGTAASSLTASGDGIHYSVIARIRDGAIPPGYVVERKKLSGTQGAEQVRALYGIGAALLVGNARGDLWTDFTRPTAAPPVDVQKVHGALSYDRPENGARLAWVADIPDTPWTLVVEFSRATVLAHAHAVEWRIALFGLLILGVAAMSAWIVSGSFAHPISELASAADAISRGDYSRRVHVARSDEVGALAVGFNGMAESITAARAILENQVARIAESESRLHRVIGASSAVIYELRFSGEGARLEWISENVKSVLGYETSEPRAPEWWLSNIHPDDREALVRRTSRESYRDGVTEYRFRAKDGRYRWLREEHRLVLDTQQHPVAVVGAWLDITDQRELEQQFRQVQKMEAVGRLAGGVAHDFNNLLTVIRSYTDLLLLDIPRGDPRGEELFEIRRAADRAAALARQLLAFSRKQVVQPRVFDVNDLVRSFEAMLSPTLPSNVSHVTRLAGDLGAVRADSGQLEQVLMNLVLNAVDAMPDGGELAVETANTTLDAAYAQHHAGVAQGEYVRIAVSDTGTGMDATTLDHLYEPFYTTKPSGEGTGLGLSTVYGIVKQNGGHIVVSSELGRGTTFTMYFPRVDEEISGPRNVAARVSVPGAVAVAELVLVVEDDPAVRSTLVRILERQGYRVLAASHGGEAMRVAAAHAGAIDLVISDLMMPEMNGREFIDRFSAGRPETPVLFMSGYTDDPMLRRPGDEHRAFIEKPFTVEEITRKVREVLSGA